MNLTELSALFDPRCSLTGKVLLVTPPDFTQLVGCEIKGIHTFIVVSNGSLTLLINGKEHKMQACTMLDMLDWNTIQIMEVSPGVKAYCLFPTQEFTGESLNNLKPGPEDYFLERLHIPVFPLSGKEHCILENELQAMAFSLYNIDHFYRHELVCTHFKTLILELGNIMLNHYEENKKESNLNKRNIIIMGFLKLIWKHYRTEHNIDFYAKQLDISPKHLARVVKEMLGKTPHEVICNELIQDAITLLQNPRISILEISTTLHFSEQAAFCKFFKKQMKVSPTTYRRTGNKPPQPTP